MSDRRRGWAEATLQELAGIGGLVTDGDWIESKDQDPAGSVRLIQLMDVGEGEFRNRSNRFLTAETAARLNCTFLERGDVLIARMPDPLGRACVFPGVGQKAITAVDILVWRRGRYGADPRWLMQFINSPDVRETILAQAGGTTRQRVSGGRLKVISLPVPPLPEQRRIVAKLDSLFARTKAARDELAHIPILIEHYKQALLEKAFTGELTANWRNANGAIYKWQSKLLGEAIEAIVAGKNLRCEERPPHDHEHGVLKVSAVTWGKFDPLAAKTLPANFDPPEKTRVRSGDLLISRANTLELVGAVVLVKETPDNLFLSDKVLRLEAAELDKPWLLWFLRSPAGRAAIQSSATGNQLSMRNLGQQALCNITMPWPTNEERTEIVRRIEIAVAWLDHIAAAQGKVIHLLDHLNQGLLGKAFRGELVPQDPNDEPAEKLLERIRAGRDEQPKTRRSRKTNAAAA
jgi:type I restriction enzyme, S subunit